MHVLFFLGATLLCLSFSLLAFASVVSSLVEMFRRKGTQSFSQSMSDRMQRRNDRGEEHE